MTRMQRRRKEQKTDYSKRFKLLKSGKPRVTFRRTNKYIISQYVVSEEAKDKTVLGITSKDLFEYGWPKEFSNSLKSIPATYLTGFLIGKNILEKKLEMPIVDLGMHKKIRKNKLFAFLKGLIDAGIKIECPKEYFPEEERIEGKNLKKDFSESFKKIKDKIEGSKK